MEDVEDVFNAVFQVAYSYFGDTKTHDLIPDGGNVAVTNENRQRACMRWAVYFLFLTTLIRIRQFDGRILSK